MPSESKVLMQEQFNMLNKELMAANEERIVGEQEIQYWRQKYQQVLLVLSVGNQGRQGGWSEECWG